MNWIGLPVGVLERLEQARLSRDDRLLYVEATNYAAQYLTDGVVLARLAKISDHPDPESGARRLIEAEVWSEHPEGYIIADYFKANMRREEVEKRQADAKVRNERSRKHRANDHSMCRPDFCKQAPNEGNASDTRNDTRTERDTLPTSPTSPYLPDQQGKVGKGEVEGLDNDGAPDGALAPSSPEPDDEDPAAADDSHEYEPLWPDEERSPCRHCELGRTHARHQVAT